MADKLITPSIETSLSPTNVIVEDSSPPLSCFNSDGTLKLIRLDDFHAVNNSLYYSATQDTIVFKDDNGTLVIFQTTKQNNP